MRTFTEETQALGKWPKVVVTDEAKRARLENVFRTRFGAIYSAVTIGVVKLGVDKMFCEFKGEGESWCMNVGRSHQSNRVYGVVDKSRAYIRCHCSCATTEGRLSGKMCKDFSSEHKFLTPKDVGILWGGPEGTLAKKKTSAMLETPCGWCKLLGISLSAAGGGVAGGSEVVAVVDYFVGGLALGGTYGVDLRGLAECCQIFGSKSCAGMLLGFWFQVG